MQIQSLCLVHFLKNDSISFPQLNFNNSFYWETCQRKLWLSFTPPNEKTIKKYSLNIYYGLDAYTFLLRITTGIESALFGETDVFGQFKKAYKEFNPSPQFASQLRPLIQNIYEDTKDIRTHYLQHIGGNSYGSLARKLLSSLHHDTLIIGSGQIAQSIIPYFNSHSLTVWNRTQSKLTELKKYYSFIQTITKNEELNNHLRSTHNIIICTPINVSLENNWIHSILDNPNNPKILHFGAYRHELKNWNQISQMQCLSDLFDLQKTQNERKGLKKKAALQACRERAILRSLGSSNDSLSTPHGWEDLAAFA